MRSATRWRGGTLHVGSRVEAASGRRVLARTVAGAWEGEMYSVYAFVTGAGVDNRAVVDLFRALRIHERVDGVSVRVRRGRGGVIVEEPTVAVEQSELGLMEISQLTWRTQRGLPRWKGTRARGGELFRDHVGDQIEYLLLVNDSSLTTIQPRNGRRFDAQELDMIIDELEVDYVDNNELTVADVGTDGRTPERHRIEGDIDALEGLSAEQREVLRERRRSGRRQLRELERHRRRRMAGRGARR